MGKDRGRREAEERARRQEQQAQELQNRTISAIELSSRPTPLQEALDADSLGFLNWEKSEGKDVGSAPGMSPWLDLYNNSIAATEEGGRAGAGLFQLGSRGADPTAVALANDVRRARERQQARGVLERAFNLRRAEARGSALPLIGLTQQRQQGAASMFGNLAGNAGNRAEGAWDRYFSLRSQPGFGSQLLSSLIGGGAAVASGGLSSGGRWSR